MEPTYVIAVDSGKNMTKAVLLEDGVLKKENRYAIDTRLTETNEIRSKTSRTSIVTMDGKSTIIGAEDEDFNTSNSKKHDLHRRATYLSISKLVPNGASVVLGVGTTILSYLKEEETNDYRRFMLGLKENEEIEFPVRISFMVDGTDYQYHIQDVIVSPESSGHIVKNYNNYLGTEFGIVDIGGLNINGTMYSPIDIYDPNSPIDMSDGDSAKFTISDGVHFFSTELEKKLNDALNLNLSARDMRRILLDGYIRREEYKEESARIVKEEKLLYAQGIHHKLKSYGWSIETMNLIFVGGGSALFKDELLSIPDFKNAKIPEDPAWENVEGFAIAASI